MPGQAVPVEMDVRQGGPEADDPAHGQRRHGKKRNSLKTEHQGKSQTEPIPRNLQIKNIILFFYI